MSHASLPFDATELLKEAAEWRLLGLLFEYPSPQWRASLKALLPSLSQQELRTIAGKALAQATEGLHIALFGPAGTVPVREVTYQGGVQSGYLMAELSAYYDAFGYQPRIEEAADHLSVELGFLAFLKMKQAYAVLNGDLGRAKITAEAAAAFLKQHLARQAEPVLRALEIFAPESLVEAGKRILEHAGPAPRSDYPLSSPLADEGDSEIMSCGPSAASDELVQLQP